MILTFSTHLASGIGVPMMKQLRVTFAPGCEKTTDCGTRISGLQAKSFGSTSCHSLSANLDKRRQNFFYILCYKNVKEHNMDSFYVLPFR
jgi:hypothetical protein